MTYSSLSPSDRLLELFPNLLSPQSVTDEQSFLRFKISDQQIGLIAMVSVKESLLIEAEQITPIPNMPVSCLGLMNSRDEVFPVIDFPLALEIREQPLISRQYQVIVVDTQPHLPEESLLGLIIPQVQGVNRFKTVEISDVSSEFNANVKTVVQGVLSIKEEQLWVVDAAQLKAIPSLQ